MLECDSLDKEPVNRPGLVQAVALHGQVQVTVVLDRVAIGVEKSRVPVAQCLVAFGAMERQAYVTAGDVEPGVLARHDYHRCLGVRAMVTGTGFGHVDDRRIVEHRAVSLGNGLEPGHQGPSSTSDKDSTQTSRSVRTERLALLDAADSREALDFQVSVARALADSAAWETRQASEVEEASAELEQPEQASPVLALLAVVQVQLAGSSDCSSQISKSEIQSPVSQHSSSSCSYWKLTLMLA